MSRKIQIKCQFFQVSKYFEDNDNKKEDTGEIEEIQ